MTAEHDMPATPPGLYPVVRTGRWVSPELVADEPARRAMLAMVRAEAIQRFSGPIIRVRFQWERLTAERFTRNQPRAILLTLEVVDATHPLSSTCPECEQGKHTNCDGYAWDYQTDRLTECHCANRDHTP